MADASMKVVEVMGCRDCGCVKCAETGCDGCHNFAAANGGAVVVHASSAINRHTAANTIESDAKLLWLPRPRAGVRPFVTISLGAPVCMHVPAQAGSLADAGNLPMRAPTCDKPRVVRSCGVLCWHVYTSNPAILDIALSSDGRTFAQHDTVHLAAVSPPRLSRPAAQRRWLG